jgi:hypothetical protein
MEGNSMYFPTYLSPHSQDAVVLSTMCRDLLLASGLGCSQFSVILGTKLFSDESSLLDVEENMHCWNLGRLGQVPWYCFVFWNSETFSTPLCEECGGLLSPIRKNKGCVCHTVTLPFTFKSILMQKKNYWKFKYFTMQKYIIFKKNPLKETKSLQYIITL